MADRAPPPPNVRPAVGRQPRTATTAAGVRRNLFQSHLSRRPTATESSKSGPGASSATNGISSATTHANGNGNSNGNGNGTASKSSSSISVDDMPRHECDLLSESSDIVIRDANGEFEIGDPPSPPLDDLDEEAALDEAQESERERHRLAATVRLHQMTRMSVHPEEALEALRASMRAEVAALAEDNWMYEAEEPPRVH
ncbi:hypothetical protein F4808DRAFT_284393 [Astrocystis sublimbata]|nr:hypothetical protein F4808DRAFT_284393 [Astrocystis sublimbata]